MQPADLATDGDARRPSVAGGDVRRMSVSGRMIAIGAVDILRAQGWFIALALGYLAIAYALTRAYGQELRLGMYGRVQLAFFVNLAIACILGRVARTLVRERPGRPLRIVWADLVGDFAIGRRIAVAVPALILLPLVLSATTSVKAMIGRVAPFAWDARLADIDAILHGGVQPWQWLQPLLGQPQMTGWIDGAYGPIWFWMLLVLQFWQTFSLDPGRTRFLIAFVLCWVVLGNGLAMAMASAGPVYYSAAVAGPDPFALLRAYLASADGSSPLLAVAAQAHLWQIHASGEVTVVAGISAMPSLHIAMGSLLVLAVWRLGRIARILSVAYLAVLLVGSVHLGWHYAIDGYVAILGTAAIWWGIGRVQGWRRTDRWPARHPKA
ncbi:MAG: phosphatase PAP2 family protein, partial [Pseudomonadota bacterium]